MRKRVKMRTVYGRVLRFLVRVEVSKKTQADKSETSRCRTGTYREHRLYNASREYDDRKPPNRTMPISNHDKTRPLIGHYACKQRKIRNRDQIYFVSSLLSSSFLLLPKSFEKLLFAKMTSSNFLAFGGRKYVCRRRRFSGRATALPCAFYCAFKLTVMSPITFKDRRNQT